MLFLGHIYTKKLLFFWNLNITENLVLSGTSMIIYLYVVKFRIFSRLSNLFKGHWQENQLNLGLEEAFIERS